MKNNKYILTAVGSSRTSLLSSILTNSGLESDSLKRHI